MRQKNESVRVVVEGRRNTCRETERGTRQRQWSRVVVDGRQTRRRKSSRGGLAWWWLEARRDYGGWWRLAWWWLEARRDCGGWWRLAWWWQEARVVAGGSRGRRNLQRRNGSCAREEEGVLFFSPNQTIWPRFHAEPRHITPLWYRFPNTRGLSPLFGTGFSLTEAYRSISGNLLALGLLNRGL